MAADAQDDRVPHGVLANLISATNQATKAGKKAVDFIVPSSKLRQGPIFGTIGFFLGVSVATGACIATSLVWAPIFVPAGAIIGGFSGILLARDGRTVLVRKAWDLRDEELEKFDQDISSARKTRSYETVKLYQEKRNWLATLSPDELISYYGLGRPIPDNRKSEVEKEEAKRRMLLIEYKPAEAVPVVATAPSETVRAEITRSAQN